MKSFLRKIISTTLIPVITLAFVCGGVRIQGVMPEAKAATDQGKFVKDIAISYASSKDEAQKELGDDYIILDQDFNEGLSGSSWIGYTTTDDPEEAIRDIKAEKMSGKHSVSDYEELLKNQRDAVVGQIDTIVPALVEYANNYDNGLAAAIIVNKALNYYYEDDSGMNLGDFLLKQGRALTGNSSDETARKALETVFVEGNDSIINVVEKIIVQGVDPKVGKKGSWHTRMGQLGPDGLIDLYKAANPKLKTVSAVTKQLEKDFGTDVDVLMKELPEIQKILREYEATDLCQAIENEDNNKVEEITSDVYDRDIGEDFTDDMSFEELGDSVSKTLDNVEDTLDVAEQTFMSGVIQVLKDTSYGPGQSLYDFFMKENLNRTELYTMAYALSIGQKSVMEDTGLLPVFQSIISEYAEMDEETNESMEELEEGAMSVYEGVDRDVFDGDTALTEDALKRMQTQDDNSSLTVLGGAWDFLASAGALIVGTYCTLCAFEGLVKTEYVNVPYTKVNPERTIKIMEKELLKINNFETILKLKYIQDKKLIPDFNVNVSNMDTAEAYQALQKQVPELKKNGNYNKLKNLSEKAKEKYIKSKKIQLEKVVTEYENRYLPKEVKTIKVNRLGARIGFLLGAAVAFAFVGYEIYTMVKPKPGVSYTEIPANMVSRTYDGNEIVYLTYSVARTANGKKADLHNWKGDEWVAIYTTSDENAGDPVLANSLYPTGASGMSDPDYKPVSEFCYKDSCNLLADESESEYLFFKTGTEAVEEVAEEEIEEPEITDETESTEAETVSGDAADVEGSVFGGSSMIWIILLIVVVVGVGAGTGIYFRKKKKTK